MSTHSNPGGTSRIELDARLLNSLFSMFVNKPGGPHLQLEQGQLQVQMGPNQVVVDPVNLAQALRFHLRTPNAPPLSVQVTQVQLGGQGLSISLQLQA
mgnify:CR=1 FL=1